jgi:hypothetical protein
METENSKDELHLLESPQTRLKTHIAKVLLEQLGISDIRNTEVGEPLPPNSFCEHDLKRNFTSIGQ